MKNTLTRGLLALSFTAFAVSAQADEIQVLSTNALKTVLEDLGPKFEKATEHKLALTWGTAAALKVEIEKGKPVDVAVLTRLLTIELRPSPGISAAGGQFLTPQDFFIQTLERAQRDDHQTYVVRLKTAVLDGRVAILRLKLSNEPGLDDPTYELRLRSAVPFTATGASCGRGLERETLDGVMRCLPWYGPASATGASFTSSAGSPGTSEAVCPSGPSPRCTRSSTAGEPATSLNAAA